MSTPTPVVLCGKSAQIGQSVKVGLHPDYEVIHFVLSPEAGAAEIPALLRGEQPSTSVDPSEQIGTQNYSRPPVAIVTGGAYTDEAFATMRDACAGESRVPWLRPDLTTPMPPLGPEYGKRMVERVKACLSGLEMEGKLGVDGVVWF